MRNEAAAMKFGYAPPSPDEAQEMAEFARLRAAGCEVLVAEDSSSDAPVPSAAFLRCLFLLQPGDELMVSDYRGVNSRLFVGHFYALVQRGVHFLTLDDYGEVECIDVWIEASAERFVGVLGKRNRPLKKFGYALRDPDYPHFDLECYILHEFGCDPVLGEDEKGSGPNAHPALIYYLNLLQAGDEMIFSKVEDIPEQYFLRQFVETMRRGVYFFIVCEGEIEPCNSIFRAMHRAVSVGR